ncbi:MAG: M50 family metallopeptidase [Candidatus Calescibacterium sp.]|nr:M50 family metallopeptidase [Candidatus Calescibacterium sp.]MCX7971950.1 M50 family metallopeptidase [bacterium]MDW8195464.1 M50 family metallopeptidase [Candidatus Calescibacterium sp.]
MELVSVLLVILAFFFIIIFHELGHYVGCKLVNVRVEEFSVGLGKELWSKKIGDTKFSFRLLPIGGYVLPEGEEYKKGQELSETNFYAKPLWARLIVIALGPIFNYILAIIIFFFLYTLYDYKLTTEVLMVVPNTPAQKVGLQPGDIITRIDSTKFDYYDGQKLINYIHRSKDKELEIEIKRGDEVKTFKVKTMYNKENNFSYIGFNPRKTVVLDFNPLRGITEALYTTYNLTVKYVNVILSLLTGGIPFKTVIEQSAGPIGITKIMYDFANNGIYNYLVLVAFINIVIGLFNLFPFPALDGGRILFIFINYLLLLFSMITKVRLYIDPDKEEIFHKIGLVLLLILIAFISYNDIMRIIRGESFIR